MSLNLYTEKGWGRDGRGEDGREGVVGAVGRHSEDTLQYLQCMLLFAAGVPLGARRACSGGNFACPWFCCQSQGRTLISRLLFLHHFLQY